MRSGLYSSLLTLLGAAGLALTQGPVRAESPQGRAGGPGGAVLSGSVFDAEAPAQAPAGGPVRISGPVPMEGHGDYTQAPGYLGNGGNNENACCGIQDNQFFGRADYLLYRFTNATLPPLTLNAPVGLLPIISTTNTVTNGTLSSSTTLLSNLAVVFQVTPTLASGTQVDFGDIPGGRFTFGYWFDPQHTVGMEYSFFVTTRQDFDFSNANGQTGAQNFPTGLANTTITITGVPPNQISTTSAIPITVIGNAITTLSGSVSSQMWGQEINLFCEQCQFGGFRWSCLGGMRYINLNEDVTVSEVVTLAPVPVALAPGFTPSFVEAPAFTASTFDHVTVHDHFIGPQIGINYDWCLCHRISLEGFLKLAIGDMHEAFSMVGFNTSSLAGTTPGGLLVGPGDSGTHRKRDRIAAVPEFQIDLCYQVTPRLRLFMGYDTLYLSTIARTGSAITTAASNGTVAVGGTTVPVTLVTPAFNPVGSSLWVEGFNAGLEFRF